MTKRELMEALASFHDDTVILSPDLLPLYVVYTPTANLIIITDVDQAMRRLRELTEMAEMRRSSNEDE